MQLQMEEMYIAMQRNFFETLRETVLAPKFGIGHHFETTIQDFLVIDAFRDDAVLQGQHAYAVFFIHRECRIARDELFTKLTLMYEEALGLRLVVLFEFGTFLEIAEFAQQFRNRAVSNIV